MNTQLHIDAIQFCAKVQVGNFITSMNGKSIMRVDTITDKGFYGQARYKGKSRGVTALMFTTLLNPHYGVKGLKLLTEEPKYND